MLRSSHTFSLMKENLIGADDLITTFAQQRQVLLKHTAEVLCADSATLGRDDSGREEQLSAILMSSLEVLKVAEEELLERTEALADLRSELEQRLRGEHELFEQAPVCLLVSDRYGVIIEANHACVTLLRRDRQALERQPLADFIPPEERRRFREGLGRIVDAEGVSDWRFLLVRPTDAPLAVSAAIRVIKATTDGNGLRLLWSIRVLDDPSAVSSG